VYIFVTFLYYDDQSYKVLRSCLIEFSVLYVHFNLFSFLKFINLYSNSASAKVIKLNVLNGFNLKLLLFL
jgi:hypothetical protein